MWQTMRFALFAAALLLASGRQVSARSTGAPVQACGDLTQQHFGSPADCGRDCPFTVSLVAVDGTPVAAGAAQTYKCGSEHTREKKFGHDLSWLMHTALHTLAAIYLILWITTYRKTASHDFSEESCIQLSI